MSSAFSDFGPLTERRRAERQRLQRWRLMVAGAVASVLLILIVMGGAVVAYNASSKAGGGSWSSMRSVSSSIKAMCAQTDFRDACEKSLAKVANNASAGASSPKDIVRSSVEVTSDATEKAFARSQLITSDNPRVKAAVADCKEIYGNARDDLARTLSGIDAGGVDGLVKRGYQLRVWLSAVIAHQETCIDGFPDGDLKTKMSSAMESGKELMSNALAIIEKASSSLAVLGIPASWTIPRFVDRAGYLPWNGAFGLETLWYAGYGNRGPSADTAGRVNWPGYKKVISKAEASKFTVQSFLHAEPWIKQTGALVQYGMWA